MKCRIFLAALLIIAAAVAGRYASRVREEASGVAGSDEARQSYRLAPGSSVEVRGINGPVEVETAETDMAEVHVTSTAGSAETLADDRVFVEQTPSGIVVRGGHGRGGFWDWMAGGARARHEVRLRLPRDVALSVRGVNGQVEVGEVEGSVEVSGVNGRVEMAQSSGRTEVKGVNGGVTLAVARLGGEGLQVKGVNGNVEIRLRPGIDADVVVKGHNGGLRLDVPNVTDQERRGRRSMRARLGSGGPVVNVKGVNGNVSFKSEGVTEGGAEHVEAVDDDDPVVMLPPPPPLPPAH